jgi:hypothetical protein
MEQLYENPKSVFEYQTNETIQKCATSDVIEDIMHLLMLQSSEKKEKNLAIVEIYNLLGTEKFTELIELLDGQTVKFPSKEEFKETLITALCFYYRKYLGKSWLEIKELIGDEKLKSIKYSIHISQLQRFIDEMETRVAYKNKHRGDAKHEW